MKWIKRNNIKVPDNLLLIEKLAKVRGIKNITDWINPPSKYVHSPYDLLNMNEAVEVIVKAIHKNKVIRVVADIDTDGVCSTGIMYNYLKQVTSNVGYIHSQRSKGHGVETVLDQIEDDVELVIIVDSSSNSVQACKEIKDRGIDVIIIDHHMVDNDNPNAIIVNCQLGGYPNKHLSGSAMTYKVCQVLDEYLGIELADNFLDLTAIGLVADMMDIKNMENRYLIYNGINRITNLGIQEILKQSTVEYANGISTTNISFKVAPIIGACSRFDMIELALEAVTSDNLTRISELTNSMIKMNEKRKTDQKEFVERAVENVDDSHNIIIYVDNDVESGFRGLIATDFVERFSKPVLVVSHFTDEDGTGNCYRGSARSIGVVPLKSICEDSGLFSLAQGHEGAFGVEFAEENLDKIISFFDNTLDSTDLQKVVEYDLELNVSDIEEMDIRQVEKFSKIVGQGFPEPKFLIRGLVVEEAFTKKLGEHMRAVMGKNKDTIKIICEGNFALMKFRSNESYALDVAQHFYDADNFVTELDVIGSLNLNSFYNFGLRQTVTTNQVFLEDYRIVE